MRKHFDRLKSMSVTTSKTVFQARPTVHARLGTCTISWPPCVPACWPSLLQALHTGDTWWTQTVGETCILYIIMGWVRQYSI